MSRYSLLDQHGEALQSTRDTELSSPSCVKVGRGGADDEMNSPACRHLFKRDMKREQVGLSQNLQDPFESTEDRFQDFISLLQTFFRDFHGPSSNMTAARYDHIIDLPTTAPVDSVVDPHQIAEKWLGKLESIFEDGDFSQIKDIFNKDSWWRDIISLQWDFRTIHGNERIEQFLRQNQSLGPITSFKLEETGHFKPKLEVVKKDTGFAWISSLFHFETRIGRGSGVLRLTQEKPGEWKAFSVYTSLQELKGFEEPLGTKRAY